MKEYSTDNIRNIALIFTVEQARLRWETRCCSYPARNDRFGRTDDASSVLDFDPEEQRRKTTISTSIAPMRVEGEETQYLGHAGYFDFVGEVAIGAPGMRWRHGGGRRDWRRRSEPARVAVRQRIRGPEAYRCQQTDRENTDFRPLLSRLTVPLAGDDPLYLPVGKQANFKEIVDVVRVSC